MSKYCHQKGRHRCSQLREETWRQEHDTEVQPQRGGVQHFLMQLYSLCLHIHIDRGCNSRWYLMHVFLLACCNWNQPLYSTHWLHVNAKVQDYRGLCLALQDSTLTLGLQGASKDLVVSWQKVSFCSYLKLTNYQNFAKNEYVNTLESEALHKHHSTWCY